MNRVNFELDKPVDDCIAVHRKQAKNQSVIDPQTDFNFGGMIL